MQKTSPSPQEVLPSCALFTRRAASLHSKQGQVSVVSGCAHRRNTQEDQTSTHVSDMCAHSGALTRLFRERTTSACAELKDASCGTFVSVFSGHDKWTGQNTCLSFKKCVSRWLLIVVLLSNLCTLCRYLGSIGWGLLLKSRHSLQIGSNGCCSRNLDWKSVKRQCLPGTPPPSTPNLQLHPSHNFAYSLCMCMSHLPQVLTRKKEQTFSWQAITHGSSCHLVTWLFVSI